MISRCFAAAAMIFIACPVRGADWPQWRGPERTGHAPPDTSTPARLPAEPNVLWRIKVGDGLASPVVASGRLFRFDNVAGKETLHALDAATGAELWSATVEDAFKDTQSTAGPRCTQLVDGDRVFCAILPR